MLARLLLACWLVRCCDWLVVSESLLVCCDCSLLLFTPLSDLCRRRFSSSVVPFVSLLTGAEDDVEDADEPEELPATKDNFNKMYN